MTGIYIRVQRGEKWESLDLAECTRPELATFFGGLTKPELIKWLQVILLGPEEQ